MVRTQKQKKIQFTRAEVSRMSNLDERMIRYYEKKELLHPKKDYSYGKSGVIYDKKECLQAITISNLRDTGLDLNDIEDFLFKNKDPQEMCLKQIEILEEKKTEIEYQQTRLMSMYLFAKYHRFLNYNAYIKDIYTLVNNKKWLPQNLWELNSIKQLEDSEAAEKFNEFIEAWINPDNKKMYSEKEARKIVSDAYELIRSLLPPDLQKKSIVIVNIRSWILGLIDVEYEIDLKNELEIKQIEKLLNEFDQLLDSSNNE